MNIWDKIKKAIGFRLLAAEDRQDLRVWKSNLACRLTTMSQEAQESAIRAMKEIDKILN